MRPTQEHRAESAYRRSMSGNDLGSFLRARRAAVRPGDDVLTSSGPRRVPGLRREEVAVLAGLSADYYTRLEQGRERHPSPQILDALARALELGADARAHLHRLAGHPPPEEAPAPGRRVRPELARLLDGWTANPAYIFDRTLDIVVENDLVRALHSPFAEPDNLARMAFLDPAARDFYVDWDRAAHSVTAHLRLAAGHDPRGPRLLALLDELTTHSAVFRELWGRHDVRGKTRGAKQFRHPDVGVLTLEYEIFDVREAPGLQMIVHHAPVGSPSAEALRLLGSLAATQSTE